MGDHVTATVVYHCWSDGQCHWHCHAVQLGEPRMQIRYNRLPLHQSIDEVGFFLLLPFSCRVSKQNYVLKKDKKTRQQENECLTFIRGKRREGTAACYVGLDRSRRSLAWMRCFEVNRVTRGTQTSPSMCCIINTVKAALFYRLSDRRTRKNPPRARYLPLVYKILPRLLCISGFAVICAACGQTLGLTRFPIREWRKQLR